LEEEMEINKTEACVKNKASNILKLPTLLQFLQHTDDMTRA